MQSQSFSLSFIHSNYPSRNTTLSGYMGCFIDFKTSNCDDCPPSCLSFNSSNIIVDNKILAKNIDKVFENQLRQISEVRSGVNKNDTYTASIYLYSLLLKNQIKLPELNLLEQLINDSQTTNSLVFLGKDVKDKLNLLTSDNSSSSPIAISIVNIISKSIDLLIDGDSILSTIEGNPNLMHDLPTQKKWILEVLDNAIIGCDESGLAGCLASSVASSGIS
ncbi:MAG: hypothetical protein ACTHL3_07855 [Candidatus Nitrosocosmicus sp.]